jgi:hypothetical protein
MPILQNIYTVYSERLIWWKSTRDWASSCVQTFLFMVVNFRALCWESLDVFMLLGFFLPYIRAICQRFQKVEPSGRRMTWRRLLTKHLGRGSGSMGRLWL